MERSDVADVTVKTLLALACGTAAVLGGCGGNPPPAQTPAAARPSLADPGRLTTDPAAPPAPAQVATSGVVARVGSAEITVEQLQRPLIEAYGLPFVLHMVSLEVARQKAAQIGITLSEADFERERARTLEQTFAGSVDPDKLDPKMTEAEKEAYLRRERERLMDQLLSARRISKPEFNLAIRTGAYLRAIAEKELVGKLREEDVREAFHVKYGEKVKVRHIQLANRREAAEAQRRIQVEGKSFEQVAREMSRDERSKHNGGEIRPFSRAERMWPAAFKEAAFALTRPGEISNPVDTADGLHLIQLVAKIAPQAVKFEDHRDVVAAELQELMINFRVKTLREEIAATAQREMKIEDPVLRRQYQEQLARVSGETIRDPNDVRQQLRQGASNPPATLPAPGPATAPAGAPTGEAAAATPAAAVDGNGGDATGGGPTSPAPAERPPATRPAR